MSDFGMDNDTVPRDPLSLVDAPMRELVAALEDDNTLAHRGGAVPAYALQIAHLIAAETIRLIRLGTRSELTEAGMELSQLLIGPSAERLRQEHPEAHRIVAGTSITLTAATAPSSSAGELTVLRSWRGSASKVVARLRREPGHAMQRADLRHELGVEESHLSHMLADLEDAGLVVRIPEGKRVTVHLGPTGRSEHVKQFLDGVEVEPQGARAVRALFERVIAGWPGAPSSRHAIARDVLRSRVEIAGWRRLAAQVRALSSRLESLELTIEDDPLVSRDTVAYWVRARGVARGHVRVHRSEPVEQRQLWVARLEGDEPVEVEALMLPDQDASHAAPPVRHVEELDALFRDASYMQTPFVNVRSRAFEVGQGGGFPGRALISILGHPSRSALDFPATGGADDNVESALDLPWRTIVAHGDDPDDPLEREDDPPDIVEATVLDR